MGIKAGFTYNGQIAGNHTFGADNDIQLDWVLDMPIVISKNRITAAHNIILILKKQYFLKEESIYFSGSRLYQHLNEKYL